MGREGVGGRRLTRQVPAESQDDDSVGWGQGRDFSPRLPCHRNQNCIFLPVALLGTSEFLESYKEEVEPQLLNSPVTKDKRLLLLTFHRPPALMALEGQHKSERAVI